MYSYLINRYQIPLIALVGALIFSVVYSGFHYSFYGDELVHMHTAYLMAEGKIPFVDFFTIYSPVFHALLRPIFLFTGYTFQAVHVARVVMIALFFSRLLIGWFFVKNLFSKPIATIFVLSMLLDPFTVFSGMQIRPDSLYLFILFLGIYFLSKFFQKNRMRTLALAGLCLGGAVVVSVKSVVIVFLLALFVCWYVKKHASHRHILFFAGGVVLPMVLFSFFFALQGSFGLMTEHLIIFSKLMSDGLWFPTRLGFFYLPSNTFIYGFGGKPVTWYLAMALPVLGVLGFLWSLYRYKKQPDRLFWVLAFGVLAIGQYGFFWNIRSMFIQYYLGVNWILSLFTAMCMYWMLDRWRLRWVRRIVWCMGCVAFLYVSVMSIQANMIRSTAISTEFEDKRMVRRWSIIPSDQPVFSGLLFRPLSQPIPYGYFFSEVPDAIKSRYGTVDTILEKNSIRYLLVGEYMMQFLDVDTQSYIDAHFIKDSVDDELWVRRD